MPILDYNFEIYREKGYVKTHYFVHIANDIHLTIGQWAET